jgi:hypothetical protein
MSGQWPSDPPIIMTPRGRVTEWARRQAAVNMRHDGALREQVISLIALELRIGYEEAAKEHKRRYPEAWGL